MFVGDYFERWIYLNLESSQAQRKKIYQLIKSVHCWFFFSWIC